MRFRDEIERWVSESAAPERRHGDEQEGEHRGAERGGRLRVKAERGEGEVENVQSVAERRGFVTKLDEVRIKDRCIE